METDVEKGEISKEEMVDMGESLLHDSSTVLVAINGTKSSKLALKWALNAFLSEGKAHFKLFYVRPPVTVIPTPSKKSFCLILVRYYSLLMKELVTEDKKLQ